MPIARTRSPPSNITASARRFWARRNKRIFAEMRFIICCILLLGLAAHALGTLPALVDALRKSDDPQFHMDVLKGMSEGLKGRRDVKMPAGWDELSRKFKESPNPDIRELARGLSVTFGSKEALEELRQTLLDTKVDETRRRAALQSLVAARDPELVHALTTLLKEPP